jgi:hypothetical protein
MPAFTPNRNYPYSLPSDPADVPEAIQDLAEAINDDVQANVQAARVPRIQGWMRGGQTQTIQPGIETALDFQIAFRDNDNMVDTINAPTVLTVQTPGFYLLWGITNVFFDLSWTKCTLRLKQNGNTIMSGDQEFQSAAHQYTLWSESTMIYCNAGDTLSMTFNHNSAGYLIIGTTRELYACRMSA